MGVTCTTPSPSSDAPASSTHLAGQALYRRILVRQVDLAALGRAGCRQHGALGGAGLQGQRKAAVAAAGRWAGEGCCDGWGCRSRLHRLVEVLEGP